MNELNLNNFIEDEEILTITRDLIAIEGHKDTRNRESKVSEYIFQLLNKEKIEAEIDLIEDNRPNVYGFIRGKEDTIELMFNGHIDTIPGFDMDYAAFDPFIKDGKIYGRGSCDMKAGLAASLASMIALKRAGIQPNKTVMFAGVIGEEERSKGTERLIDKGIIPKLVVIGEPTSLKTCVTHKGMEWIELKFIGRSTHGSRPHEGINAIYMASNFCKLIQDELQHKIEANVFDLLGSGTINVGVINGGNDPNIVPDACSVQIDRRWLPNEKLEDIHCEIKEVANKIVEEFGGSYEIRAMREKTASMINAPHSIDINHPLVKEALLSVENITNIKQFPSAFPAWSDAGILSNNSKAKCIILGPGNINQAHANDEFCDIEEIVKASHIYLDLIINFCL